MEFLLLCKPIVLKGIVKPDVHHCQIVIKKCDSQKCTLLPMSRTAPQTVVLKITEAKVPTNIKTYEE